MKRSRCSEQQIIGSVRPGRAPCVASTLKPGVERGCLVKPAGLIEPGSGILANRAQL
jgi:hypothetical protein